MKDKVTCVIPAHNEEKRIGAVLKAINGHPLINQIIVVNDGSKDDTDKIVRRFKDIKLISYKKNVGKIRALFKGIRVAKGNILMLIDADLIGINKKNISDLIYPVISKEADVSMAIDYGTSIFTKILIRITGMENLTGLRVFNKKILKDLDITKIPGYGFETLMNKLILDKKLRLKIIYWENVRNTLKSEKVGFIKGMYKDLIMDYHVIKTVGVFGYLRQLFFLHSNVD